VPPPFRIVRFADRRELLASRSAGIAPATHEAAQAIIEDVRVRRDVALLDLTERFDGVALQSIRVAPETIQNALDQIDPGLRDILEEAIENVRRFHQRQLPESWTIDDGDDVVLGQRVVPVDRAGLYAPGGTAAYPSSVIMDAVPAQVAGVGELHLVSPPGRDGHPHPHVLAAAALLGIDNVYAVGGAQAIAALAFGTESIPAVDVIVGPGNEYVAAAKALVIGQVGIDSIAGPSEIVVLADESANPRYVAADMLAQAEHDSLASAILVCLSEAFAREVEREISEMLPRLDRKDIAADAIRNHGGAVVADSLDDAIAVVNEIAPEHLEIITRDPWDVMSRVRHAGAIFLGSASSESVGDYFAGPNHVLPTNGSARFASALSVDVFLRKQSIICYSNDRLRKDGAKITRFAEAEGLGAHALAVQVRLDDLLSNEE